MFNELIEESSKSSRVGDLNGAQASELENCIVVKKSNELEVHNI